MATKTQVRQAAKYYAKKNLSENFGACVAVSLIASLISSLSASVGGLFGGVTIEELSVNAGSITAISDVFSTIPPEFFLGQGVTLLLGLLIAPITIGCYSFYMHLSRGTKLKVSDLFIWFGDFSLMGKAIGGMLLMTLLLLGWTLLGIVLPISILLVMVFVPLAEEMILILMLPVVLLMFAGVLFVEIKSGAYTAAVYLLAVNPETGARCAFRTAKEVMRGHLWEFFILQLSFIFWHFLASVTCGLSVLYVTPYITLTNCYFFNHVLGDYHRRHNPPTEDDTQNTANEAQQTSSDDSVNF